MSQNLNFNQKKQPTIITEYNNEGKPNQRRNDSLQRNNCNVIKCAFDCKTYIIYQQIGWHSEI